MNKKEEKHYVTKDELWDQIKEFYESDTNMSDALGVMVSNIANKIMTSQNFSGYVYRQEMISDAILRMVTTLSEKKFKLWSDAKCKKIEKRIFKGYCFEGDPELEEGELLHVANMNQLKVVSVFEVDPEHFFHDVDEDTEKVTINPCWHKSRIAKGVTIVPSENEDDVIEVYTYIESERKINGRTLYVDGIMYDAKGEAVQQKSNAFGYLSLIAHHEAITRIKKEKKNTEAIRTHQEDEFVIFMSENCEMTPQRIFDDSYEIDNE